MPKIHLYIYNPTLLGAWFFLMWLWVIQRGRCIVRGISCLVLITTFRSNFWVANLADSTTGFNCLKWRYCRFGQKAAGRFLKMLQQLKGLGISRQIIRAIYQRQSSAVSSSRRDHEHHLKRALSLFLQHIFIPFSL